MTKPVGLKGGVRVELLCDGPERLSAVGRFLVGTGPDSTRTMTLQDVSVRGNGVVVFFAECSGREEAEALRDAFLFIPESQSVAPPEGSFRIDTLLGCEVRLEDDRRLGVISNVYDLPGQSLLGVTPDGATEEVLVPRVDAWIRSVDVGRKLVILTSDELFTQS